ncbi:MAG: hypothetical protein M3275_14790, partial [Thermoproteota archaeon]|nr:hypothetical protein [Thermoproteota archaeon]
SHIKLQYQNMSTKKLPSIKNRYGETVTVAISLPASILGEIEKRRQFDSRSHYILRAVSRFLNEEESGVKGTEVSNPSPPTPTPTAPTTPTRQRPSEPKEVMM